MNGNHFADFNGFSKSMLWGAVSGAASFGIGQVFGPLGIMGHEALHGVAHGIVQGGISELSSGDFGSGFVSGAVGSWSASGFEATELNSNIGELAFGGFMGGVSSSLSGGNFWNGLETGLVVTGLNHLMHQSDEDDKKRRDGKGNKFRGGSKKQRDQIDWKKYPSGFRGWYEQGGGKDDYKLPEQPDPDLDEVHKDWEGMGRPKGGKPRNDFRSKSFSPNMRQAAPIATGAAIGATIIYLVETYGWMAVFAL